MRFEKIYLVDPPRQSTLDGFPGSLSYMKLWLEEQMPQIPVELISFHDNNGGVRILDRLSMFSNQKNTLVGITATTATYQSALDISRNIKRINKDIRIILGGHHVMYEYENVLKNHACIDYVATSNGEKTLQELAAGKSPEKIKGLAFRSNDGTFVNNEKPDIKAEDLDRTPLRKIDIGLLDKMRQFDNINYISSRGCPYSCYFCSVGGQKIISRSPELIIDDLKFIVEKFPEVSDNKRISFQDNFFGVNKSYLVDFSNMIKKHQKADPNFRFNWDCQTRVELIADKGIAKCMKEIGCVAIYLGVENFSDKSLEFLKKSTDVSKFIEDAKRSIINLLELDIEIYLDYIIGLPEEDSDDVQSNILALKELGGLAVNNNRAIHVFFSILSVYPGTGIDRDLKKMGLADDIYERYTEWELSHEGRKIRHFLTSNFGHGSGGIPIGILDRKNLFKGIFAPDHMHIRMLQDYINGISEIPGISCYYQMNKAK